MKIRKGLVSNSSSSSFCIIGIAGDFVDTIAERAGFDIDDHYLSYGEWTQVDGKPIEYKDFLFLGNYEIDWIGFSAPEKLAEEKTLSEIKHEFIRAIFENFNISIPFDEVGFYYGEICSG
jgi:hypothetical protein